MTEVEAQAVEVTRAEGLTVAALAVDVVDLDPGAVQRLELAVHRLARIAVAARELMARRRTLAARGSAGLDRWPHSGAVH